MNLFNNLVEKSRFLPFLLGLFTIALQIQWTLSVAGWDIRFSLSDLLLPFLILYFVTNKDTLKYLRWNFSWLPSWVMVFSIWLGLSLLRGYLETGKLSNWAFFNKFIGWFVLIGYLIVGHCLSRLNSQKLIENSLLKTLFISSACISLISLVAGLFSSYGFQLSVTTDTTGRFFGFLENPNAYGLFCVVAILLQMPFLNSKKLFSSSNHVLIATLNGISIVCSGSRGAWASLLIGLIVCSILKIINLQKLFLIAVCVFLVLFVLNMQVTNQYVVSRTDSLAYFDYAKLVQLVDISSKSVEPPEHKPVEEGILQRIGSAKLALKWWKESPLMGIGLGQFLVKQQEDLYSNMPKLTIHNTLLWLLTETGIIGLLLFLIFVFNIFQILLYKMRFSTDTALVKSGLAIFAGFSIASLTMEVAYQRYLWYFLGVFLFLQEQETRSLIPQGLLKQDQLLKL